AGADRLDGDLPRRRRAVAGVVEDRADVEAARSAEPLVRVRIDALTVRTRWEVDRHSAADRVGPTRTEDLVPGELIGRRHLEGPGDHPDPPGWPRLARNDPGPAAPLHADRPLRGVEDVEA